MSGQVFYAQNVEGFVYTLSKEVDMGHVTDPPLMLEAAAASSGLQFKPSETKHA